MNAKIRTVMTLVAVMLVLGLFSLEQSTSAQSVRGFFGPRGNAVQSISEQSSNSNCRALKGRTIQVFDTALGVIVGPVTKAGVLNGAVEDIPNFDAGVVTTPDPNVVAYTSELTITTIHGQLKASPVTTFNTLTGFWSEWGSINPATSTGRFAGATGVIFFSGKTLGSLETGPYEAEITGEICFADN